MKVQPYERLKSRANKKLGSTSELVIKIQQPCRVAVIAEMLTTDGPTDALFADIIIRTTAV